MKLKEKHQPSQPCSCDICKSYCLRPGWWTVEETEKAIENGLSSRIMNVCLHLKAIDDFQIKCSAYNMGKMGKLFVMIFATK